MTDDDPRSMPTDPGDSSEPGHGRRELLRMGAHALRGWIAEVMTPRRRITTLVLAIVVAVIAGSLMLPVLIRADDSTTDEGLLAAVLGVVIGAIVVAAPLTI